MNQLNNVILEGTLTCDPEIVATSNTTQNKLVKFTVASDRYYKDKDGVMKQDTLFIPVQCWGELGERCMEKVEKGMNVRVVGRLMLCKWENKNGEKRSVIEIVCNHLEYRNPKNKTKMIIIDDEKKESDSVGEAQVIYDF